MNEKAKSIIVALVLIYNRVLVFLELRVHVLKLGRRAAVDLVHLHALRQLSVGHRVLEVALVVYLEVPVAEPGVAVVVQDGWERLLGNLLLLISVQ